MANSLRCTVAVDAAPPVPPPDAASSMARYPSPTPKIPAIRAMPDRITAKNMSPSRLRAERSPPRTGGALCPSWRWGVTSVGTWA